jgi:RNA polymerase primary sigma factor
MLKEKLVKNSKTIHVKADDILSRKDKELIIFNDIDAAERVCVRHILSHPKAKSLFKKLLKKTAKSNSKESKRTFDLLNPVMDDINDKADLDRLASALVPETRFNNQLRNWINSLPGNVSVDQVGSDWVNELRKLIAVKNGMKNKFMKTNIGIVYNVVNRYPKAAKQFIRDDLLQEGLMGLSHAVEKFDQRMGWSFSTYAYTWVESCVNKYATHTGSVVYVPYNIAYTTNKLKRLNWDDDCINDVDAVSKKLKVSKYTATSVIDTINSKCISLDTRGCDFDDGSSMDGLISVIGSESETALDKVLRENDANELHSILSILNVRELDIIKKRFGFDGKNEMSLEEIGSGYDLTRERIRQIEYQALGKLRKQYQKNRS